MSRPVAYEYRGHQNKQPNEVLVERLRQRDADLAHALKQINKLHAKVARLEDELGRPRSRR